MNPNLALLKKVLRPVSRERADEIARAVVGPGAHEQVTLEDAGLADEVRQLLPEASSSPSLRLPAQED